MSENRPFNHGIDLQNLSKVVNLTDGVNPKDAINKSQLEAESALKQDVLNGNAGILVDGANISVDLATAGSDYSSLIVGNTGYSSLNGSYARLPYQAYLEYSGTDLDLFYGGDYNIYYKDNGSGVWAIVARREIDGEQETYDGGSWLSVLVTVDPTSITSTYASFVPNYQAVNYDSVANADAQDETVFVSPAEGSYGGSTTSYAAGSTPAGLLFDNNKLALDFANTIGEASSTKVFPSSVVLTEIQEAEARAKDLANHPFNNVQAQITGNPSNMQSAAEGLASEVDTLDGQVSALQTKDISHDAFIEDNRLALGLANGEDNITITEVSALPFLGGATNAKALITALGTNIGSVYSNVGGLLGLGQFDADFGTGFTILRNNGSAKELFEDTEAELQNISLGLGQFWQPVEAHADENVNILNPATDTFGGAVVLQGERVLLIGQSDATENGIYIFDTTSTPMVRAIDADVDDEFTPNKTVQVLSSAEEGISGATFAYNGSDAPDLETDNLIFELKSKGVVGDNTITEGKLAVVVANKLNAKVDKFGDMIVLTAGQETVVNHGLNTEFPNPTIFGDTGYLESYTVRYINAMSIGITSTVGETIRVSIV